MAYLIVITVGASRVGPIYIVPGFIAPQHIIHLLSLEHQGLADPFGDIRHVRAGLATEPQPRGAGLHQQQVTADRAELHHSPINKT